MLDKNKIPYRYRDYREEPLSQTEIRNLLRLLEVEPRGLLRRNDKAAKELDLTGAEDARTLIRHMASHPTLIQRPIGLSKGKAVLGRPPQALLALAGSKAR